LAGVERVVLLSSGAVAGGDIANAVVRYNVVSEAAVRDSGLSWTILRPSGFHANALQWAPQLRAGDIVRESFAEVPIAAIDPLDIAAVAAVAALALTAPGHEGASYRLTGPEPILAADRVRVLAGRELQLEPLTNAEAREQMSANMPPSMSTRSSAFLSTAPTTTHTSIPPFSGSSEDRRETSSSGRTRTQASMRFACAERAFAEGREPVPARLISPPS